MDDERFAAQLRAGDPSALEALMECHMGDVYAVAARILPAGAPPEEIEEAAAEAFLAAWEGVARYDPARAPLRTWLLMHAKYAALAHARRSARWARPRPLEREEGPPDPFEALAAQEARDRMQAALRSLPPLDREIVYRRYFLDEDIASLAQDLGLMRGAVDNRLSRARSALRKRLAQETDGGGGDADGPR